MALLKFLTGKTVANRLVFNATNSLLPVDVTSAAYSPLAMPARETASCGLSRLPCRIIWQETAWSIRPATLNT
jgi:hypothetical protein